MKYKPENLKKAQEAKKIKVIAIKGDEKLIFESQMEAEKVLGINASHIAAACRKDYGYKKLGGYEWEYADEKLQNSLKPIKVGKTKEELKEFYRNRMVGNKYSLGKKLSQSQIESLRHCNTKTVYQFSKNGEFILEYYSVQEATRKTGITHIDDCCRGKRKTAGGFVWRYENEEYIKQEMVVS
jgi:hypothetical protein